MADSASASFHPTPKVAVQDTLWALKDRGIEIAVAVKNRNKES